jgi:hypothetical protein
MMTDAERLRRIRDKLDALDGAEWQLGYLGERRFVTSDGGGAGHGGEIAEATKICTDAEFEFMAGAPGTIRFLLGLIDRAKSRIRALEAKAGEARSKDYPAEAAMKLQSETFRDFLARLPEVAGLEVPDDPVLAADTRLKAVLSILSKREFGTDERAALKWRGLVRDFDFSLRHGQNHDAADYDAGRDAHESYFAALEAKRERGDRHWPGDGT